MNYKIIYFLVVLNCYCFSCFIDLRNFLDLCKKKAHLNKKNHQKKRFYAADISDCDDSHEEGAISIHINNHYKKNPRIFEAEECEGNSEKDFMANNVDHMYKDNKKFLILEADFSSHEEDCIPSNLDSKREGIFYKKIRTFFKIVKNYF